MGSCSVVGKEVIGRLLVLVSLSGRVMERVWGRLGAVGGRGGGEGVNGSGGKWVTPFPLLSPLQPPAPS